MIKKKRKKKIKNPKIKIKAKQLLAKNQIKIIYKSYY